MSKPVVNARVNGTDYSLIVLKVTEHDANGRPAKCEMGYDDSVFHLEGGEEFITAFVPTNCVQIKEGHA